MGARLVTSGWTGNRIAAKSQAPADFRDVYDSLGGNVTHIAEHYGVGRARVRGWRSDEGLEPLTLTGVSVNASGGVSRRYKPEPVPFIAPPTLPGDWKKPKRPKVNTSKKRTWIKLDDVHCPDHDEDALAAVCAYLADNEITDGIINGDLLNMDAVSTHAPKDEQIETVNMCLRSATRYLKSLIDASPSTRWIMHEGNHEDRLRRYILRNAPALWGVRPGGDEAFVAWHDLRNLLQLDNLGIELHPSRYPDAQTAITPKFVVTHGDHVKAKAGNSAHAALEKSDHSFAQGHDHRAAMVFKTKWGADNKPSIHLGMQGGFLGKLEVTGFGYNKKPDWQQAINVITAWPDGLFCGQVGIFVEGVLMIGDKRYG